MKSISRRGFIERGTIAALGLSVLPIDLRAANPERKTVKVGVIGTGGRGMSHISTLLGMENIEINAVCDLTRSKADSAADYCVKAGKPRPNVYCRDENTWKELLDKEKLDCVIIATYWDSHAAIALHAMKNGIYPGIEVPAALTVEDTWQLVETSEKTGIPCMMLENWSFRQDNLAALNMKRQGMFGEIVHCH